MKQNGSNQHRAGSSESALCPGLTQSKEGRDKATQIERSGAKRIRAERSETDRSEAERIDAERGRATRHCVQS